MAYSITPTLRKDRINKRTEEFSLVIRVTIDRRHAYFTIDKIKKEDWNSEKLEVRKSHPNYAILNTRITNDKATYQKIVNEIEVHYEGGDKIEEFRKRINRKSQSTDFFEFVQKLNDDLYTQRSYSTYKRYISVINKFKEFYKKERLSIGEFKLELIRKFESHLISKLKNNQSTVTSNMKVLSFYLNQFYIELEIDLVKSPFTHYKMKPEEFNPTFLEMSEIRSIMSTSYTPLNPLNEVKKIFLFECFCGMRVGDILELKWKNFHVETKELHYVVRKTKKRTIHPLNDMAFDILNTKLKKHKQDYGIIQKGKYIFGFLKKDITNLSKEDGLNAISSSTALINRRLKKIAKEVNINKNLSTHVGRHTYATLLVSLGGSTHYVKDLLGHSSLKMTERYVSIVENSKRNTNNLLNNIFDKSNNSKHYGRKRKRTEESISND